MKKIFTSKLTPVILLLVSFSVTIFSDVVWQLHNTFYVLFNLPVKAIGFTLLVNNIDLFKRILSTKFFTFMGKISFSLYLIHIPILFSIGAWLYLYAGIVSEQKILIIFLLLTAINIVLSYIFMLLVDNNAIKISDRVGKYFSSKQ